MFPTAGSEELSQVTSLTPHSELTSDAHNSSENTQVSQQNSRELTVNMLLKEMLFCIALALTTYGALHNTPTKVSKHPQAVKFFSEDSIVTDWYQGQLTEALASIHTSDISFVMYYAPWDAESQYVRGEFEKAASVLGDRVHFIAINCWNPGSECRLQHKIPSWPILMAYTVFSKGVHYKGPKDAHSMVNFLELIMRPLKRISSTEDLINLLSYCDAVAVGYTPLSETSKYYNVWYHVSLKTREYDVIGEICFATVTSEELAIDLGVEIVPNARLMLWNETKVYLAYTKVNKTENSGSTGRSKIGKKRGGYHFLSYTAPAVYSPSVLRIFDQATCPDEYISEEDGQNKWNETSLMLWVLENFSQPVARIIPMWKKAFSFERYVDGNPILMMFTPLNPIYEQLPNYALMREIAMDYYNCKNNESSQWVTELMKLQRVQRLLYQQKDYLKFCQEYKFKKPIIKPNYKKEVESNSLYYQWNNTTQKIPKTGVWNNFFGKRGLGISRDDRLDSDSWSLDWLEECSSKTFPADRSFYDSYEQCKMFKQSINLVPDDVELHSDDIETTMLPLVDDPLSPENLIQDSVQHFCKLMKFAQEFSPPIYPSNIDEERHNMTQINGLACANNFSLYMIAIDSVHNHHFAESLGIDMFSKKDMTAVVILDSQNESQYLLSEELSAKSLREFIYNFTNKSLKRSLRTSLHVDDSAHTHFFGSIDKTQAGMNKDGIDILDLTSKSFRRLVRTPGPLTIVSVCGGPCGAHTSRAVAAAARLLAACGVPTRAARLDARRHDLPWQYTVDSYPTVLVFPTQRGEGFAGGAESVSYPRGRRITTGGVAALALRSLGAPAHLRVRLALCNQTQSNMEKKTCLRDIREHITTVIGRNLKYWRRTENRELKDALFKRLQHLHQVALELCLLHSRDLSENNAKQSSLLDSLAKLAKNWEMDVPILRNSNRAYQRS